MKVLGLVAPIFLLLGSVALASGRGMPASGLDRSHVVLKVEWLSNWTRPLVVAADCNGDMKIVGVYSDTTAIEAKLNPSKILSMVNGLLEMNFFELPAVFPKEKVHLALKPEGKLDLFTTDTMDGGVTKIQLYMGKESHTVVLEYPAYGKPEGMDELIRNYRSLVDEVVQRGN